VRISLTAISPRASSNGVAALSAESSRAEPFLRWVGGKRQIVRHLARLVPTDGWRGRYIEPFLGAGSLYFALAPKVALLSDANPHLIQCYEQIRERPHRVSTELRLHADAHSSEHYYGVRSLYNASASSAAQAARFIYLNHACFNGVFRVNMKGEFNVPYGKKEEPNIPSRDHLLQVASSLERAELRIADFEFLLSDARRGDFVYLDPPYPALNETAFFAHYTKDRFGDSDQERLAECVRRLARKGCKFMMSNADVPQIRRLYREFRFVALSVTRFVSCKKNKHQVSEVVITNY
jgi:DNA adenine methylase